MGQAGPTGPTGAQGPTAVSADANNLVKLGSDNLLWVNSAEPLRFSFSGKPSAISIIQFAVALALTLPGALAGSVGFINTPSASGTFTLTLNRIRNAASTSLGTIVWAQGSSVNPTLTSSGGALLPGDILQLVPTGTINAQVSDISVTLLTYRN
jgi:hypothetical protein